MFKQLQIDKIPLMPNKVIVKGSGKVLTTGNFIQLTGQAKTCKTSVLMEFVKSLIDGKQRLGFDFEKVPIDREVVYINTELSAYDFYEFYKKVLESVNGGKEHSQLKFFDAQSLGIEVIKQNFKTYLKEGNPYVIIIDGVVDFVESFNNEKESKSLVDYLLAICKQYSCSMILTLHQNPGNFQIKSRGHLGTYIEQKASGTLITSKLKNNFSLKGIKLRSAEDFKIDFQWSETGLIPVQKGQIILNEKTKIFEIIKEDCKQSVIIKKIMKLKSITRQGAYNVVKSLIESGEVTEQKISSKTINLYISND